MPPPAHDAESRARYFLRLLAALCLQGGGEIVIDNKYLRQIDDVGTRQALSEDACADDSLVLRYGSKHSAMYPVEPLSQTQPQPSRSQQQAATPSFVTSPNPVPAPRQPLTTQQLAAAERKLRQARMAAELKQEQVAVRAERVHPQDEDWLERITRPQS